MTTTPNPHLIALTITHNPHLIALNITTNPHFNKIKKTINFADDKDANCKDTLLVIGQASGLMDQPISVKRIRFPCQQHQFTTSGKAMTSSKLESRPTSRGQIEYKRQNTVFVTSGNSMSFYFRHVRNRRFLVTYKGYITLRCCNII